MSPEERRLQHSKSQPLPVDDNDGKGQSFRITPRTSLQSGVLAGVGDVTVNKDDISSRLSILKTRGRTGQGRRMTNTAPDAGYDEGGLGNTTPLGGSRPAREGEEQEPEQPKARRKTKTAPTSLVEPAPEKSNDKAWGNVGPAHPPPGDNEPRHVPIEDLEPLDEPELVMKGLIKRLNSPEWGVQMEALNAMRALSIYHATETVLPRLHEVVRAALLVVDNLRSNLSKSAIMSLSDMIRYLKHQMDPELDALVTMMVKKATETSGFIADEAKRSLTAMIEHCTETRTCAALLHANANKNPTIRAKAAVSLSAMVEHIGSRLSACRDLERLFPVVVHFLSEGSVEPRQAGKRAVLCLHSSLDVKDFGRMLRRCPEADQKIVEKLLAQEEALGSTAAALNITAPMSGTARMGGTARMMPRPPLLNPNPASRGTQPSSGGLGSTMNGTLNSTAYDTLTPTRTPSGTQKIGMKKTLSTGRVKASAIREEEGGQHDTTLQRIDDLVRDASGSDFRAKQDAFESLADVMLGDVRGCQARLPLLVDAFVAGFKDNNQKAALAAVQAFSKLVVPYASPFEHNCGVLVPAVGGALAHSSLPVRAAATSVLDSLVTSLDPAAIAAPLAQAVDFGNQRSKAALVERMKAVVGPLHDRKPQILLKTVVPLAARLLDEHKADIKAATSDLVKELYAHLDQNLFHPSLRLSDKSEARFRDISGAPQLSSASPRGR